MNTIYRYLGYSKQRFHQKMDRQLRQQEQQLLLLPIIAQLRIEHPGVGARQLYEILKPENIGRDRFEALCFKYGFKLPRTKAYTKTTESTGVIRFPNLVAAVEFTGINQAWSSDITYYRIGNRFHFLTFIIDLYSRTVVGFSVSKNLSTEQTTLPALTMALNERQPPVGMIFHSDAGGQYYSKAFLKLTSAHQIKNSMCEMAYENPHAERINGTIKNQYLKGYNPSSFSTLVEMTERAVRNYNSIRPHRSLKKLPPRTFEKILPAGSPSFTNDNFCTNNDQARQLQKNYHLPTRHYLNLKETKKCVHKMVNVFQA